MQEILLPKMGNTVEEAEIVKWFKKEGDAVEIGEPLFSIQTDKAEVECESTASGVLRKILVPEGVEAPVLTVVALVGAADEPLPDLSQYGGGAAASVTDQRGRDAASTLTKTRTCRRTGRALRGRDAASTLTKTDAPVQPTLPAPAASAPRPAVAVSGASPVSPRARKLAAGKGIDATALTGSGVGGRVIAADVIAAGSVKITPTAKRMAENAGISPVGITGTGIGGKITKADIAQALESPVVAQSTEVTLKPLTPMRRIIAERMSGSKFSAPHYYVTVEVDMSGAKAFRAANKAFKASFNDLVLFATAKALREFPNVNARWRGDAIEEGGDINLGMAVALPTGLIVPVIRQAQNLSLEGLCAAARELAEKAQTGKLLPDDYQGNTFTVSNLGAFGVDHFTAIINQPDSAIIAVGQMKDRVVVIDGGIHIRPIMKLTISSDHRVIDGSVAAQFMGRLKEILEEAAF